MDAKMARTTTSETFFGWRGSSSWETISWVVGTVKTVGCTRRRQEPDVSVCNHHETNGGTRGRHPKDLEESRTGVRSSGHYVPVPSGVRPKVFAFFRSSWELGLGGPGESGVPGRPSRSEDGTSAGFWRCRTLARPAAAFVGRSAEELMLRGHEVVERNLKWPKGS